MRCTNEVTGAFETRRAPKASTWCCSQAFPARDHPGSSAALRAKNRPISLRLTEEVYMSTFTTSEHTFQEAATYGGLVDAIGGVATIVLAIIALAGINQP